MGGFTDRLQKLLEGAKPLGYETISITDDAVKSLTIPAQTEPKNRIYFAVCALVSDPQSTSKVDACLWREDGTNPTTSVGMPLGNGGVVVQEGYDQLSNFRIIATENDRTHTLRVTYYKLGE